MVWLGHSVLYRGMEVRKPGGEKGVVGAQRTVQRDGSKETWRWRRRGPGVGGTLQLKKTETTLCRLSGTDTGGRGVNCPSSSRVWREKIQWGKIMGKVQNLTICSITLVYERNESTM